MMRLKKRRLLCWQSSGRHIGRTIMRIGLKQKWAILAFALIILLSSCSQKQPIPASSEPVSIDQTTLQAELTEPASPTSNSPVPANRVSVKRYGESSIVQSENGIYAVAQARVNDGSETVGTSSVYGDFVLYCDKDSDEFVFLCGRADCAHNDENCDAYLGNILRPIGYYKGRLFYLEMPVPGSNSAFMLCCMDADGRNKQELTPIYSKDDDIVKGAGSVYFTDGYFQIGLHTLDKDGNIQVNMRYCSLDDPAIPVDTAMEKKHPGAGAGMISASNGDTIFVLDYLEGDQTLSEKGTKLYEYVYAWDPASNTLEPVGDRKNQVSGYFDKSGGYYIEDGVIRQWDYKAKEGKDLLDTGIRGDLLLNCYPDCLVVSETGSAAETTDTISLWFYDWNFKLVGECKVSFKEARWYPIVVMSETENRIILGDPARSDLPIWYIEKSDFGTGTITLHEYHYPEMDLLE